MNLNHELNHHDDRDKPPISEEKIIQHMGNIQIWTIKNKRINPHAGTDMRMKTETETEKEKDQSTPQQIALLHEKMQILQEFTSNKPLLDKLEWIRYKYSHVLSDGSEISRGSMYAGGLMKQWLDEGTDEGTDEGIDEGTDEGTDEAWSQ